MAEVSARLAELGITLPDPPKPIASYIPAVSVPLGSPAAGRLVFVSGQIPTIKPGLLESTGPCPVVPAETAAKAARRCVVNALAVLQAELGDLGKIRQIVKLDVFVNSDPQWGDQPKVANGASDLLVQIFGDAGKHARAAVGCPALPLNATVEVALTVLAD